MLSKTLGTAPTPAKQFSFEARSRGSLTRCLRFAAEVALAPRKTRFRLVASLCRAGLVTRRVPVRISRHVMSIPTSQAWPGAHPAEFKPIPHPASRIPHPASRIPHPASRIPPRPTHDPRPTTHDPRPNQPDSRHPRRNSLQISNRRVARRSDLFSSPEGGPRSPSINCSAPVTVGVGLR